MNDTDQNTTTTPGLAPAIRTEAQKARSRALEIAHGNALDLERELRQARDDDGGRPLDQRSRAQLRKAVDAKIRHIEAQMGRVLE